MTPHDFIAKWRQGGDERRDAQPFFEDLCRLVGHQTPREADPEHTWFTYEYGATKTSGGEGWADVWKKGFFGWEAKGTDRSLERAYEQLKMYADALQNPPLLVVTDLKTIIVHTNFTNAVKREYKFTVEQLADYETRQILEAVFKHPETLRPGVTRAVITQKAAEKFTSLAKSLDSRGNDPHAVSHFLNRLLFCMFAEDIGLLPSQLFTKMVTSSQADPSLFEKRSRELFAAMHAGGDVAFENVDWFNGGLFEDDATLRLEADELKVLLDACRLDWSEIEPSIFGTLFERGLDPGKRSQLGAHYTDPETIMKIVDPVVTEPWLLEWTTEKAELAKLLAKATKSVSKPAQNRFNLFLERLRAFTVLDPACGSGNFLYLALRALKDIEKRVLIEGEALGLGRQFPAVGPKSVKGLELNDYAAELARITIWIGEIQWMIQNGYGAKKQPILQPLDQIEHRDALINPDGTEALWPHSDVVIGNPPFVGDKKMIRELGEEYVNTLRKMYAGRVPGGADLVCYWFEKANDAIAAGTLQRAGLVATNSIRGGKNREVLKHIADTGRIFNAWSDEAWINEGADVRVSLVSFGNDGGSAHLDGSPVSQIFADLTASTGAEGIDITRATRLPQNSGHCFVGYQKTGEFDISGETARTMLRDVGNPNGRSNSDVLFPYWNGIDATRRSRDVWIIDTGTAMTEAEAAQYAAPFAHLESHVRSARINSPVKDAGAKRILAETWWRLWRARPDLRKAWSGMSRVIATPEVSKHRVFVWMPRPTAPDKNMMITAREDDTTFGILQSRIHEIWSLRMCTYLGVGNDPRYTPTTCFETFPFPEGLTLDIAATDYAADPRAVRIANASTALVEARDRWLNPPEWTDRVPEVVPGYPDRVIAKPGHDADLKKRTLTNLYNARPAWLANLHAELDASVAAAYGWDWPLSDDDMLRRLFELNQTRAGC
jgi:type II restriction/modification system DNA methylase subunit YeeA